MSSVTERISQYSYSQLCCLSLPVQLPQEKYNSFFWAQKEKSWAACSKENVVSWFVLSPVSAGNNFIMRWKLKKGKKASIKCP